MVAVAAPRINRIMSLGPGAAPFTVPGPVAAALKEPPIVGPLAARGANMQPVVARRAARMKPPAQLATLTRLVVGMAAAVVVKALGAVVEDYREAGAADLVAIIPKRIMGAMGAGAKSGSIAGRG